MSTITFAVDQAQSETQEPTAAAGDLARKLGVHPLVATLLIHRGLDTPELADPFLSPKLTHLHDPALLPGLDRAAHRLAKAVGDGQPIVIYGDYDVDGVTASAILWHALHQAGADVRTYIPHRIEEGYGLNSEAILGMVDGGWRMVDGKTNLPLVVSVDCGITAVEPARVAKELRIDLIITDHHEFDSNNLPDAHTLVHPRLPFSAIHHPPSAIRYSSSYPFPHLCGAGVAFKLAWQFCKVHCGSDRLPEDFKTLVVDLLSLAALGTITDIVPLIGENRVIATYGLGRIKQTRFAGLNALIDASRLRDEKIDAYHVGFGLGPRLNACGRMGHAGKAVHLLTAAEPQEAAEIAAFLTGENDRRRATERAIFEEARLMVIDLGYDKPDCRAIVLGKEGWHPGVVGIVAGRLVEAFARPAIMLNFDNGEAHGSARSVEGLSIHEAFTHCSAMLTGFGGHAMAAGLRLETRRVEEFRTALVEYVNARLTSDDLFATLNIDATCALGDVSVELINQLQRLAPFGAANPAPILCVRGVTLDQSARRMGSEGKHLSMTLRDGRCLLRAVAWNMGDLAEQLPGGVRVDVVFEPRISDWHGARRAELHVKDLKVVE